MKYLATLLLLVCFSFIVAAEVFSDSIVGFVFRALAFVFWSIMAFLVGVKIGSSMETEIKKAQNDHERIGDKDGAGP